MMKMPLDGFEVAGILVILLSFAVVIGLLLA